MLGYMPALANCIWTLVYILLSHCDVARTATCLQLAIPTRTVIVLQMSIAEHKVFIVTKCSKRVARRRLNETASDSMSS